MRVARTDGQFVEHTVRVDNTGPILDVTGVAEGQELRGTVDINATATDAGAGLKNIETLLDGERVELPFTTAVSYTRLDVYKRQAPWQHMTASCAIDWPQRGKPSLLNLMETPSEI